MANDVIVKMVIHESDCACNDCESINTAIKEINTAIKENRLKTPEVGYVPPFLIYESTNTFLLKEPKQ